MTTPANLAELIPGYPFAYLLTANPDGRPHVSTVTPVTAADGVEVPGVSGRALDNLYRSPAVTLVWPPPAADGYTLIVDGDGAVDGDHVAVTVQRAVLHRPQPGADPVPGGCAADCIEVPR